MIFTLNALMFLTPAQQIAPLGTNKVIEVEAGAQGDWSAGTCGSTSILHLWDCNILGPVTGGVYWRDL